MAQCLTNLRRAKVMLKCLLYKLLVGAPINGPSVYGRWLEAALRCLLLHGAAPDALRPL